MDFLDRSQTREYSEPESSQRPRLLIIEDSVSIRQLYRLVLEAEGYTVLMAENGTIALDMALRLSPDLLLIDLILPDMNGWDLLRTLRAAEEAQQRLSVPAVILTAADAPFVNDMPLLGIAAVLDKAHLRPPTLVGAVHKALSVRRQIAPQRPLLP